jgi:hypothetical protein
VPSAAMADIPSAFVRATSQSGRIAAGAAQLHPISVNDAAGTAARSIPPALPQVARILKHRGAIAGGQWTQQLCRAGDKIVSP